VPDARGAVKRRDPEVGFKAVQLRHSRAIVALAVLATATVLLSLAAAAEPQETRSVTDFGPDLAVNAGDIVVHRSVLLAGMPFNVSITVYNLGDEDASGVTVDVLVDGKKVDRVTIDTVAKDAFEKATFELTLQRGTHEVTLWVDLDDQIDERREDNNHASVTVEVMGLPDAAISAEGIAVSDTHPMEGDVISIDALVRNLGESQATLVLVQFWDGTPNQGTLIANRTTSILTGGEELVTATWDTAGLGGTHEINLLLAMVLPGEDNLENNLATITVLIFTQWDMVVDAKEGDKTIDQEYTQDGFVTVRDGATLTIDGITFSFLQDYTNQFALFVEDGASLVLEGATVESDKALLVILEGGASLKMVNGSTLMATVLIMGDVTVSVENSVLSGGLSGTATSIMMKDSEFAGPLSVSGGRFDAVRTEFVMAAPATLSDTMAVLTDCQFTGGVRTSLELEGETTVELRNVTCGDIISYGESKALIFRRVTIQVEDESTLVIPGTAIEVRHFINGTIVATIVGGDDGSAVVEVLSDVIEGGESHFIGNYLIEATFKNLSATTSLLLEPFPAMYDAANLPGATVVLPPVEPTDLVATTAGDLVLEATDELLLVADFVQDGNIVIRGTLTVSGSTLSVLQDREHQFYILVEGSGRLVLQGGNLVSDHPLNVYLYDDASLEMSPGSGIYVNALVAQDSASVTARASELNTRILLRGGPVTIEESCQIESDLLIVEGPSLKVEGGFVSAEEVRIDSPSTAIEGAFISADDMMLLSSFANVSDSIFEIERINVQATILTLTGSEVRCSEPLSLDVATFYVDTTVINHPLTGMDDNAKVYLYDADVPRPFSLSNNTVYVFWYLTVSVQDLLGNPVSGADVQASFTQNNTPSATGITNDQGRVRFPLIGSIVGQDGEHFIGNYRIVVINPMDSGDQLVRYVNLDRGKLMVTSFSEPLVQPTGVEVEAHLKNNTVEAGSTFVLSGTAVATYPVGRRSLNEGTVMVKLLSNANPIWQNTTALDGQGAFAFEMTAPDEPGAYSMEVEVTGSGSFEGANGRAHAIALEVVPPAPTSITVLLQPVKIMDFEIGQAVIIHGIVVYDGNANRPVPGAKVFANDAVTKVTRQTTADGVGAFQFTFGSPLYAGQWNYPVWAKDTPLKLESEPVDFVVVAIEPEEEEDEGYIELIRNILIVVVIVVVAIGAIMAQMFYSAEGKMVECGECGTLVPDTAKACPKCGIEFEDAVAKCSECGDWIPAGVPTCPKCGTAFRQEEPGEEPVAGLEETAPSDEVTSDLEPDVELSMDEAQVDKETVKQAPDGLTKEAVPRPVVQRRAVRSPLKDKHVEMQDAETDEEGRPRVKKISRRPPAPEGGGLGGEEM
jgi:hypothetical protein